MPPTPSPEALREQLIDEALVLLQPASAEPLTREDAREALDDWTGLFEWLLAHKKKVPVLPPRPAERRDPSAPPPPPPGAQAGPPRKEPRPRRRASRQE